MCVEGVAEPTSFSPACMWPVFLTRTDHGRVTDICVQTGLAFQQLSGRAASAETAQEQQVTRNNNLLQPRTLRKFGPCCAEAERNMAGL
jgi:hypothetical protein